MRTSRRRPGVQGILGHESLWIGPTTVGDMIDPMTGTEGNGFIQGASEALSSWLLIEWSDLFNPLDVVRCIPKASLLPAFDCLSDPAANVEPLHFGDCSERGLLKSGAGTLTLSQSALFESL